MNHPHCQRVAPGDWRVGYLFPGAVVIWLHMAVLRGVRGCTNRGAAVPAGIGGGYGCMSREHTRRMGAYAAAYLRRWLED